MQGTFDLTQPLNHLDHVQYMISDRTTIRHFDIVDHTRHFVSLYIVKYAKIFFQPLKDLIWLGLLKSATELIV